VCASEWPSSVLFRRRFTFRRRRSRVSISHPADINVHWYLFHPRRHRFGERISALKGCLLYIIHGVFVQVSIPYVVFIYFFFTVLAVWLPLVRPRGSTTPRCPNRSRTHSENIIISRLFRDTCMQDLNIPILLLLVAIKQT